MKVFVLVLISWFSFAQASTPCERAGIASLKIGSDEEVCLKSTLNAQEKRALDHITQIHQEVARVFRVEVVELFSRPFSINISEYVFGPFVSSASPRYMNLGVYPNDDFRINTGTYIHELGHVLAGNKNPKLPGILADLDHSVLFSETFADLLALTVHGHIITPSENPNCLDRLRYISNFQNYDYPQEYFENMSSARLMQCCDSILKNSTEEKFLNLCREAGNYFSREITFTHSFDPLKITKELDDHQVGIPFLSFLKDFSEETSLTWKELFDRILFSQDPSHEEFTCTLSKDGVVLRTDKIKAHTAFNLIQDLRKTLSTEESIVFEELFTKHVIEKGLILSEREAPKHLEEKYQEQTQSGRDVKISCHK